MWIDHSEDEFANQAQKQASVGQGGGTVPGSNTAQGNPSTISPVTSQQPQQQPASIQDYLKANTNQANDLGQKVTSSLSDTQNQEKNTIDQSADSVKNDVNSNTINYDSNLVNKAKSDPTSVANNSNDLNSFLKQWNASYSGPQSFESTDTYNNAAGAANQANQKAQQLQTAGGREQLIGDQFGVYGQGNKGLDQALLETSSSFPTVQDQAKQFGSVQDYLGSKAKDVDTAAQQAQATTDATKAQTQGAFSNSLTDFQKGINDKTAAAQGPAQAQANTLKADFASGDPAKVVADLKQVNPNIDATTIQQYLTAMNTQGGKPTDLSQFYSFNPNTAVTTANAATADDYSRAAALQKLTGVDYSGVLNPTNASQAGTAPSALSGISPNNIADYLKTQYANSLLTSGGGNALTPATPGTPGVPGLPSTPAAGANFKSQMGVPGVDSIEIPANATPDTVKALTSVFNTPLSQAGSYKEGAIYDAADRVKQLKTLVSNGQITQDQYSKYAQPIITAMNNYGSGATGKALRVYQQAKDNFNKAIS